MVSRRIQDNSSCNCCYFRSIAELPYKKILLQLTERCNLHCEHCFVSSSTSGEEMTYETIEKILLPILVRAQVRKVTLTGGEPLVFGNLLDVITLLSKFNMEISICSNASLITKEFLDGISNLRSVHFNVSLDGFTNMSHGRFRGNFGDGMFNRIISNIIMLGEYGFLNGILVTPNNYTEIEEYESICEFAKANKARYVLINPLSSFGRGERTHSLGYSLDKLIELRNAIERHNYAGLEILFIRFPNTESKPLGSCVVGKTPYVFSNGDIAICPYIVFAAKDSISKYKPEQFIIGNVFEKGFDLDCSLNRYELPSEMQIGDCCTCVMDSCSKGCYAAKISMGLSINCADKLCPMAQST